jgi:hypothetical protein
VDPEDPQKAALYAWEETWGPWNFNSLTVTECRAWIVQACAYYDVPPPRVRQHRTREFSWCHVRMGVISLQGGKHRDRGGRNVSQALHEAAHWIVYQIKGDVPQDHGPTFLGVYMWLLEAAQLAPRVALHASARAHGLKWRTDMSPADAKTSH